MRPALSIIIPTFRRPQILRKCLDCIAAQTIVQKSAMSPLDTRFGASRGSAPRATRGDMATLEVIVVSDGPDEKTAEMMVNLEWSFELQYFAIPKSQQGVCRNKGFEKARGEYVMFIGDDIFLASDACERHLKAHTKLQALNSKLQKNLKSQISNSDKSDFLVLGHTTWHPSLKITPLMRWMEKSGVQFGYPKIEEYRRNFLPKEIQHFFTYTSHISLPADVFHKHRFREDVTLYGWEDVEWGKRLADSGVSLFYEPNAKAYHHHEFTDEEVQERSRLLGESAVKMEKFAPGMRIVPRGLKKLAYLILSFLPTYRGRHRREFLSGIKKAK